MVEWVKAEKESASSYRGPRERKMRVSEVKMKARLWISVLSILMILALLQTGFAYSGNELVEAMRGSDRVNANASGIDYTDYVLSGEFRAYIHGVCDATRYTYNIPDSVTLGQLVAVVSKYLKNHPEEWNDPAVVLVIKALKETFPLKGGK
jgi:hypothetical protein